MSDSRVDEYADRLERWRDEFAALRTILWDTDLTEALKWHKPCYTHAGTNIVIFQPLNDLCALMFFKGALLNDPKALLREQGENSRSSLRLEFRAVADVTSMKSALRDLVADGIRVQRAGLRVKTPAPPTHRDYPDELAALMEADPGLRERIRAADTRSPTGATCSTSTTPSNQRHARLASSACRTESSKVSECTTERRAMRTIVVVGRATGRPVASRRQSRWCLATMR